MTPETTPQPVKRWSITKREYTDKVTRLIEAAHESSRKYEAASRELRSLKFRLFLALLAIPPLCADWGGYRTLAVTNHR